MGVFELFEETNEQVIVKVNAKDPLTVARHPYVTAQMEYVTVTRGEDNNFTIVRNDGSTFSFHEGRRGHTVVSEDVERLKRELKSFLAHEHVFLDARTNLNPYAAEFYEHKGRWYVDFEFCDTKDKGRAYFSPSVYRTPESLVETAFAEFNELFKSHKPIASEPNCYVGTVYKVEIGEEW